MIYNYKFIALNIFNLYKAEYDVSYFKELIVKNTRREGRLLNIVTAVREAFPVLTTTHACNTHYYTVTCQCF
jgi:hypothetical protein